jgi:hypothetical protein
MVLTHVDGIGSSEIIGLFVDRILGPALFRKRRQRMPDLAPTSPFSFSTPTWSRLKSISTGRMRILTTATPHQGLIRSMPAIPTSVASKTGVNLTTKPSEVSTETYWTKAFQPFLMIKALSDWKQKSRIRNSLSSSFPRTF